MMDTRRISGSLLIGLIAASCSTAPNDSKSSGVDDQVTTRGTIEVTARLVEIPEGAIFKRDLYNYATVLKYQVLRVHRGDLLAGQTIYVGHYNPFLPRAEAADRRVSDIGGNLRDFRAGDVHRMALEASIDDHYMGGIVNKYFGQMTDPIYWAVWTNLADGL
jgi:hypothetical protein